MNDLRTIPDGAGRARAAPDRPEKLSALICAPICAPAWKARRSGKKTRG